MERSDFPEGFLFGSSTAAHQVEGGNVGNDWWAWEHRPGTPAREPSGDAIDHYHRYRDDFALLAALGQNAHRLSLEWSRIEPAPGEWSQAALDHYKRVLTALGDNGLTGLVTLMHFTVPQWFADRGSWLASDAVDRFAEYVHKVADELGDLMPYACTVNEPQIVALNGYLVGRFPPGHRDLEECRRVNQVLCDAHRAAVQALRAGRGAPKSGICLQLPAVRPARAGDEACEAACREARALLCDPYLDELRLHPDTAGDFVGVQYYTRMRIDPRLPDGFAPPPEGVRRTQMGWEWYPDGLPEALHTASEAGLPLIVTENGIAAADDAERIEYFDLHLRAVLRAIDEGCDVRGYVYWSSFDNFEWNEGFRPTFGLVGIDYANGLRRVVRPSALAFGAVARTRRLAGAS
ncbi:MAG: family 1 glycosylhydrolase [Streptosporangiales bacterium]|nr:family 1 glycosylhydrolase [Streptosporangiales bacterium]